MLKAKSGAALLGRGLIAAFTFSARSVLHRVRLVEDDDAVEIGTQPFDDLLDPRNLLVARVGAQRGVGGEEDALLQPDRRAWRKRDNGVTSRRSTPSADQSRWASSISLSDLLTHTARRRPFNQLSSRMPAT